MSTNDEAFMQRPNFFGILAVVRNMKLKRFKTIQETQDELVSEAEHRIKKFDDIHG